MMWVAFSRYRIREVLRIMYREAVMSCSRQSLEALVICLR